MKKYINSHIRLLIDSSPTRYVKLQQHGARTYITTSSFEVLHKAAMIILFEIYFGRENDNFFSNRCMTKKISSFRLRPDLMRIGPIKVCLVLKRP